MKNMTVYPVVTHYSTKFLNVQNHDVVTRKKRTFATARDQQKPLGLFMHYEPVISVKFRSGCSENGRQLYGILFAAAPGM